ncbi:response regulator transcription factor [Conexibacter sp. SYSU D00693]|uniref:response regulator n=1 Tax=Conexibacter sp. SYSU D00693 TaxID=2812560 RepID=UPI00196A6C67|nr:response regulator transcription factor [Conexibacter sp. SYSU D00693]
METLTVVLADDHEIVRDGLRLLLDGEEDLEVVAEAGTVPDALRYVRGHKPDVLVLDLNMPGGSSLDALPEVFEASPDTAVVVLTMQSSPDYARKALRAGVRAYVLKEAAGGELVEAMHAAVSGRTYLTPSLGARLAAEPDDQGPPDGLTPREAEIAGLLALGYTNAEIAERLVLSRRTVETHRASLQGKLDITTRAELVRYAFSHGLVALEDDAG